MNFLKKIKFLFPMMITLMVIACVHFTKIGALKIYPSFVNFMCFMLFFTSLFAKETIIQKFARMADGELSEPVLKYTRNLTYIWVVFIFCNFWISVVTIFLPEKIWMVYNGCVSYTLMGIFFAIEYPIRIMFKRKHNA